MRIRDWSSDVCSSDLPLIESHAHSLDISGFTIRRGSEKFTLQDIPVSQILPEAARSDIVIRTYERDEDERSTYLEIDFEIREYDERVRIHFRAVENDAMPDILFYEVEDEAASGRASCRASVCQYV